MQIAEGSVPLDMGIQRKMQRYREKLLAFGMLEPTEAASSVWHWLFYKPATELTAFIVNLKGNDQAVEVVYGYASTAFIRIAGDENALIRWGVSDENINIREKVVIREKADEDDAAIRIAEMYRKYLTVEKDALLVYAKEKRKAFIHQIAVKLKPLGFKKKANSWKRSLESGHYITVKVQKSMYSDEYYFNVWIEKEGTKDYIDCYYTRIAPKDMFPMDWQTLSREEFDAFLTETLVPTFEHMIQTPLKELGKLPQFWSKCHCDRKQCEYCWMEKNIWEARENVGEC